MKILTDEGGGAQAVGDGGSALADERYVGGMATITGFTTGSAYGWMGSRRDGVQTSSVSVRYSFYRVDDGPIVHEKLGVSRQQADTDGPWPIDMQTAKARVPNEQVVRVVAELVEDRWVWTDIVGVVEDAELTAHAEALLVASPPVYPSDELTLDDGSKVLVPDVKRVAPFEIAGFGTMQPTYRIGRNDTISFGGYESDAFDLAAFDDLKVFLALYAAPSPDELQLMSHALENLVAAGPELRDQATPYVVQYYRNVREMFSDEDCEEYGIPLAIADEDIWDHVTLQSAIDIQTNVGSASKNRHPDSAYVVFEGNCTWEEEHGLLLSYLNGNQLARVSDFDGHPTKAAAFNNADMLDEVF